MLILADHILPCIADGDSTENDFITRFVHELQFARALSTTKRVLHITEHETHPVHETIEEETLNAFSRLKWLRWVHADPTSDSGELSTSDLEGSLTMVLKSISLTNHELIPLLDSHTLEEHYLTLKEGFLQGACWECSEAEIKRIGGMYIHSRACVSAALRALHNVL
jgi:hypothetical protein